MRTATRLKVKIKYDGELLHSRQSALADCKFDLFNFIGLVSKLSKKGENRMPVTKIRPLEKTSHKGQARKDQIGKRYNVPSPSWPQPVNYASCWKTFLF